MLKNVLTIVAFYSACIPLQAQADRAITTFQDMRYSNVARQGQEPSCGAASVATILNSEFGESLDATDIWFRYLQTLPASDQQIALENGLSLEDIAHLVESLGYRADVVQIELLDLASTNRPVIVYIERGGASPFKHFLVLDRLEGTQVVLRDPVFGNRRQRIERFVREWRGQFAVFITARP